MSIPPALREPQGQYRYDPRFIDQQGPARLFPYTGQDGLLRYGLRSLSQNWLQQGQVSQPWSLTLQQVEHLLHTVEEQWLDLATLLADWEVFQSGWCNLDLPADEQFDSRFMRLRRALGETLKTAEQLIGPAPGSAPAVRTAFYQALEQHDRSRPAVQAVIERAGGLSDREFARQRLAGQNPIVIRRVQASDQPILQSWNTQVTGINNGKTIDLTQAAAEQRLFLVEYPALAGLTATDLQPGRYVGAPTALFYRGDRDLVPLLIQLEPGYLVRPDDGADPWMQAKLYVQVADMTHHELLSHLCFTHLAMEVFAIATPRQLPSNHPVYRLLKPHFQFLLAINTRGNTILLGERGAIPELLATTRDASIDLINRAYRDHPFRRDYLPDRIQQRGISAEVLPDFPYRDDAQLLWDAIARYVTTYLTPYYPDDLAVQQDRYLQAWAAELGAPLDTRPLAEFPQAPSWLPTDWFAQTGLPVEHRPPVPRVPDFPTPASAGQVPSLQTLIDVLTQVIFTCGPQHAAVNFSQLDYAGYVPNAPLAAYCPPKTASSLDQLLPPAQQELKQLHLVAALAGIRYGRLASSELMNFINVSDRQALSQFQAELTAIEATIQARNHHRRAEYGIDYPYLLPSRIPNSINI